MVKWDTLIQIIDEIGKGVGGGGGGEREGYSISTIYFAFCFINYPSYYGKLRFLDFIVNMTSTSL